MPDQMSIFIAAPTGFLIGLLLSMPVGPVNLTIINGAAQRGFKYAMLIGLGAVDDGCDLLHDRVHGLFVVLRQPPLSRASMEVFTFVFMLFLGMKFLSAKTVTAPTHLGAAASRIEKRIDEKLHPHSAFMIGFTRVLGNMGVLLFWIVAAAYFMSHEAYFTSHEWVEDTVAAKAAFIAGVALGANTVVLRTELYRVAPRSRTVQRTDPRAHAAHFRLLPARAGIVRRRAHRLATGPPGPT